ncbi:MAG: hypothetical protein ACWA5K_07835 [bacterium]
MVRLIAGMTLALVVSPTFADARECEAEAIDLLDLLQKEVLTDITAEQREQSLIVIADHCGIRKKVEAENRRDAFTEFMMSNETGGKEGNKRLKRLK